jgi:uncharacterized protein (TIGR02687 family)
MDLKQIEAKLNSEFEIDSRKLIFWYDVNAEFLEEIEKLNLKNAKVFYLKKDNSFYTKYFLEKIDTTNNYLLYAPFAKPDIKDNHLEDTLLYSKEFFADKLSLLMVDLNIPKKYVHLAQKYVKFFASNERFIKFKELMTEGFQEDLFETAIMCVLSKTKMLNFEEVLRVVLIEGGLEDNKILAEFEKYDILNKFWDKCTHLYGFYSSEPTLIKLVINLLITHTAYSYSRKFPKQLEPFICDKKNNIEAFISNYKNNGYSKVKSSYDEIARFVAKEVRFIDLIKQEEVESFVEIDSFEVFDDLILNKLNQMLIQNSFNNKIGKYNFAELCKERIKKHFGPKYTSQYELLKAAYYLLKDGARFVPETDYKNQIDSYVAKDYMLDTNYRDFYYYYDAMDDELRDKFDYEPLRQLVENLYSNTILNKSAVAFSKTFESVYSDFKINKQNRFYENFVKNIANKKRLVVIISDALRFECAKELSKSVYTGCIDEAKVDYMVASLPTFTKLGMASLLPNHKLQLDDKFGIYVDGNSCETLEERQKQLQQYQPNSVALNFEVALNMKKEDYKNLQGKNLIYIYHNEIDAIGDKAITEHKVFNATADALKNIEILINRLTRFISATEFIVTADHGFIYKREALQEYDKIALYKQEDALVKRRFILSKQPLEVMGAQSVNMAKVIGKGNENYYVNVPMGVDVFKTPGAGINFVHGGASLQEMIVPVLHIKTSKEKKEVLPAPLELMSLYSRITNLITYLDFRQLEPVGENYSSSNYKLYFIDSNNNRVTNEVFISADKKEDNPEKRSFKERFSFISKKYNISEKYYLILFGENDNEIKRYEYSIDIPFAGDHDF